MFTLKNILHCKVRICYFFLKLQISWSNIHSQTCHTTAPQALVIIEIHPKIQRNFQRVALVLSRVQTEIPTQAKAHVKPRTDRDSNAGQGTC
ncbi:unnamed protein product [Acanthoscelides obtectus]|uniref:Uncharacterized protein n=1 Tax=Acanthoscelides obtectus TaxID=200917 RepID=A0A9P0MB51_ACAOB|nr:unnamed protein product [Acanthoscelides obtectus]CAK1677011.1 hypothetical protein AOBTE_LOCUS31063 [Acanthoscelides obtectus]